MLLIAVLLSSMSFVLDKHFCNDELKSVSFFLKAENCHEQQKTTCPMHSAQDKEDRKNCCDNKTELIKVDIDQNFHPAEYKELNINVLVSIVLFFVKDLVTVQVTPDFVIKNWNPPPPADVYLPMHQSFLC